MVSTVSAWCSTTIIATFPRSLTSASITSLATAGVGIHLIVRNFRLARALDILFENFERGSLPRTFKLRNRFSRREQPQRVRRSACRNEGSGGVPSAIRDRRDRAFPWIKVATCPFFDCGRDGYSLREWLCRCNDQKISQQIWNLAFYLMNGR